MLKRAATAVARALLLPMPAAAAWPGHGEISHLVS
jgi:hypothetical protein